MNMCKRRSFIIELLPYMVKAVYLRHGKRDTCSTAREEPYIGKVVSQPQSQHHKDAKHSVFNHIWKQPNTKRSAFAHIMIFKFTSFKTLHLVSGVACLRILQLVRKLGVSEAPVRTSREPAGIASSPAPA